MANRFWVGGGSANTWAATANTNWAATSGGANNQTVPTTTDVAIFDSNSGVGNSVISGSTTIQGLDCTGGTGTYAGTITHNTGVTLTINTGAASSLRLTSGMTYTPATTSSIVTFTNTTGTAQITSAGKALAALTVNGVGGTVQQQDDLLVNAVQNAILTITNGVFDGNSHALTTIKLSNTNSNTRSLILGTGVTIGGNFTSTNTIWDMATLTGLTFTKNSANITVLGPTTSQAECVINPGTGTVFNGMSFSSTTNQCEVLFGQSASFAPLTLNSGWAIQAGALTLTTTAFTWTGTAANPVGCLATGSSMTVSCTSGACVVTWGMIASVVASGGATFTATNSLGCGVNTGWSITPPTDASSTGIAASVWRDTTAGDFAVAGSIGKDLFVGGIAPGAAGGHFIAGTNAATSVTTALTANVTGNITGNLSGSVGSVTGAVGSVTGNVGGNVTGSVGSVVGAVGSVTARVTANSDQIAGNATSATNLGATTRAVGRGTVTTGATTTSIPTSAMSPSGAVANQFGSNVNPRVMLFDANTATAALQSQATVISASTNSATPTFTVNALTTAPQAGDLFSII